MRISVRTNIQQQSQGTWGCQVKNVKKEKKKHSLERTRDHDSQQNRSDNVFLFKVAAFYMGLKSKVCLVSAKASALRINLNIQGCSIVEPPLHAPSRVPLLLPLLLSHNLPTPRVH